MLRYVLNLRIDHKLGIRTNLGANSNFNDNFMFTINTLRYVQKLVGFVLQGMTVLHDVCIHNRAAILSLLLSQNPKLNIKRSDVNDKQTSKFN